MKHVTRFSKAHWEGEGEGREHCNVLYCRAVVLYSAVHIVIIFWFGYSRGEGLYLEIEAVR